MYEYVITCTTCDAQRSTHGLVEPAKFSDADVITQAGHTPQCKIKSATNVTVERETRPDEPNVSLYAVKEA